MGKNDIFVSVGGVANDAQEAFIRAIEDRLRAEGLVPHTVGRNTFSAGSPLTTVSELIESCAGTVVIALERTYFAAGVEKRGGPNEAALSDVRYATPWNQIEAAMAYTRGHPLMVVVEKGIRSEGLFEHGYDWYVQRVAAVPATLTTPEFNGVLASWKEKVLARKVAARMRLDPGEIAIGDLVRSLKPRHAWAVLVALAGLLVAAFGVGGAIVSARGASAELVRTVCTGEFEASCAGSHDIYMGCKAPPDGELAAQVCTSLGRGISSALRTSTKSGNACGYAMVEVRCN